MSFTSTSCNSPIVSSSYKDNLSERKVKNLILMIGDGMGPQQISLLYYFAKYSKLDIVSPDQFMFKKLADQGQLAISTTEPHNSIVTDSACSATQLALGEPTYPEMIGINRRGQIKQTILEKAKAQGKSTGLVSDTRITHATPASFASHTMSRHKESEIAEGLIHSGTDLLFSGGAGYFIPKNQKDNGDFKFTKPLKSKRKDNKDLLASARQNGYSIVYDKKQLQKLQNNSQKVLGLFAGKNMPDAIWQNLNENNLKRTVPSLKEMSAKALDILSQDPKGFFLMIEGGQIDWAAHHNDTGWLLHEMINFNKTIATVMEWVKKNPDTLLIVTSDHETGGFGCSYKKHQVPPPMKLEEGMIYKQNLNYISADVVDRIYRQTDTLENIWNRFDRLSSKRKTSTQLKKEMMTHLKFNVSTKNAKRIIKNKEDKTSNSKPGPFFEFANEFYPLHKTRRSALMNKTISTQQGVTWSTGGHTATPVYVFSYGPEWASEKFTGFIDHSKVGQLMQDIFIK